MVERLLRLGIAIIAIIKLHLTVIVAVYLELYCTLPMNYLLAHYKLTGDWAFDQKTNQFLNMMIYYNLSEHLWHKESVSLSSSDKSLSALPGCPGAA